MMNQPVTFAICIENTDYPAAFERRKLYQALPDPVAEAHQLRRVIDKSGEEYLYPASSFVLVYLRRMWKRWCCRLDDIPITSVYGSTVKGCSITNIVQASGGR